MNKIYKIFSCITIFSGLLVLFSLKNISTLSLQKGTHISLIGNNLCSRMMNYGYFETELHARYPDKELFIRNMCDGGDTPGFRPHSGRNTPWAFEGAEKFQNELAQKSGSVGHFEYPDQWLTRLKTDVIVAFFGFNESYNGAEGLENYKNELRAFINHTKAQKYNGVSYPQLALVSPIAFQDLTAKYDLPNGKKENENLALYTSAMKMVAEQENVLFLDVFSISKSWFSNGEQLTIDGLQLNDEGYKKLAPVLVSGLFGEVAHQASAAFNNIKEAVLEKNWFWHNDYKIPNGVHVFGRRYNPFGQDNYPKELIKVRQMTANRDTMVWKTSQNLNYDLALADSKTEILASISTNFTPEKPQKYLYGEEAISHIKMAPGFKIELFASEVEFPDLANPSQISFDNKGRLWVAVMPTYPHYKPGDAKPNDKLIILEDTDNDGKADKQTIFADHLHIPAGFEFAPEGVYISQGTNLKLFTDTDGDDKADKQEIILSGFDDHDTHHVISAFCTDPSGAIYMGEGVFLHSNVETPYGTVRATNGGFMRYNPNRKHLERTAQISIPNPWGIAFDRYGQNFFAETSGPDVRWMMPSTVKSTYGISSPKSKTFIEENHRVRPTSGLEFVSSRHFPDMYQGDFLINNTIGFLGTKIHQIIEEGTGYTSKHRVDLITSDDPNFRPVDMEFAPDGSLYLADWHNTLIGHMQHNARDPLRDHVHGRIYRITYPSRPLVKPSQVYGASIMNLLDNLKLPEDRLRYRTRRELRSRNPKEVKSTITQWIKLQNPQSKNYEDLLLEGLWVTWGLNSIDQALLVKVLNAKDYHVRAAGVRVLRYMHQQVNNSQELFLKAAKDPHGRVRLETIAAASWLPTNDTKAILKVIETLPLDEAMKPFYDYAFKKTYGITKKEEYVLSDNLTSIESRMARGKVTYNKEGFCGTCHQPDGKGLPAAGFPPLAGSEWVNGSEERLIKLTLNGLYGPMTVKGKSYPGNVPMTPFAGMMDDEEMANVLTYIRASFGNKTSKITPEKIKEVREATKGKSGFYTPKELLKLHPN